MDNYKPDLTKFFNDPEWHFVEEMLSNKVEALRDIATIDLTQTAETIKAMIAGRQETIKLVDEFKHDVAQYSVINSKDKITFK